MNIQNSSNNEFSIKKSTMNSNKALELNLSSSKMNTNLKLTITPKNRPQKMNSLSSKKKVIIAKTIAF